MVQCLKLSVWNRARVCSISMWLDGKQHNEERCLVKYTENRCLHCCCFVFLFLSISTISLERFVSFFLSLCIILWYISFMFCGDFFLFLEILSQNKQSSNDYALRLPSIPMCFSLDIFMPIRIHTQNKRILLFSSAHFFFLRHIIPSLHPLWLSQQIFKPKSRLHFAEVTRYAIVSFCIWACGV